ncbi:MAG: DUF4115 domain-containing protein [Defluviicoccus sp.]|nr:DUF4115 domain-containing protein [Defluviicoccus sp.]
MPRDHAKVEPSDECKSAGANQSGPVVDAPPPRRNTVGALLRQAREGRGKTVQAVARELCMRPAHIEAIETSRLDALPARSYAAGYVRAYAAHLGFDGDRVAQRFRAENGGGDQPRELSFPLPPAHGELPKAAVLLVGGIIALVAYGGWYLYASSGTEMASQVHPVPERFAATLWKEPHGSPAAVQNGVGEAEPLPVGGGGAAAGPAAKGTVEAQPQPAPAPSDGPSPTAVAQTGTRAPVAAADPRRAPTEAAAGAFAPERLGTGDPAQNARIVLKARTDCWIEIKDTDSGKLVYARLLRAGDTYPVADRPGLRLLAGNAGGLDIMVDGKTLPPLGRPGAVVRNIALDPAKLPEGQPAQEREG